jgi:hypothetical protein
MFQEEKQYEMVNYSQIEFDPQRALSLATLVKQLESEGVEIYKVTFYMRGFMLTFKDILGGAVLHDCSYGQEYGMWETIGMPWDGDDVSVHEPEELARMIGALKRG